MWFWISFLGDLGPFYLWALFRRSKGKVLRSSIFTDLTESQVALGCVEIDTRRRRKLCISNE